MRISDWSSDVCSSDLSPGLATPAVIFDATEDFDLEAFLRQCADRLFIDGLLAFEEQEQVAILILFAVQFDEAELAGDGQDALEILFAALEADIDRARDARHIAIRREIGEDGLVRLPLCCEAAFVHRGQVEAHLSSSTNRWNR